MANLLDIRRRIRSVKSTQQITKAMKMISAARLRKAQDRILATRPYAEELRKVVSSLAGRQTNGKDRHPLLVSRSAGKTLVVLVTGDKGLAGSFNAAVLRRAAELVRTLPNVQLLLLGKKGADFYKRRSFPIRGAFTTLFSNVTYEQADAIAKDITAGYVGGEFDQVVVVYNAFKSILTQVLTEERLLPLGDGEATNGGALGPKLDYLYEPSAEKILEALLPRFVSFQIYRVLLESQAAEHAARMTAMDSATKNAGEMIDRLTLNYNRARQAAITKELIEVVSGASALAG